MMVGLLLLMAYTLVGEANHEWIGLLMPVFLAVHIVLNARWFRAVIRGRKTPLAVASLLVAVLLLVCLAVAAGSGIAQSRHLLEGAGNSP